MDGEWEIEIRDLLEPEAIEASILEIDDGFSITGAGTQLTMATSLPTGFWSIHAEVQHNFFQLRSHKLSGEYDDTYVFNEGDLDSEILEVSTLYRNTGSEPCVIFWETGNVDGEWELTFEKLR